ncbi:glycosyltransferase family 4 protein [Halobacillus yeomjeoni]|uniref:glycosyltransferase family 4 protein n=1 Tax=Halobacillus yeomjeoni TaxID=311194 RepID=UPI001CD47B6D|nr:glycosyltransferase family 4 protein [Halobacillus yeomjeoni]MCA0985139.1 glycosyltransferase family 4 protein [Halobacillus yeomjeoni]
MKKAQGSPKILHVATVPEFLPFLENQLSYFKYHGFDTHILSSPGRQLDEFAEAEGITKHEIPMRREISLLKDLKSLWKFWILLRKNRFDIVHVHTPKAGLLGMIAAFLAGVEVRIYHMHGLTYTTRTGMKKNILKWSEKLTCRLSTQTYAVSKSLREYAIEQKLISSEKIRTIQNGSINGLDYEYRYKRSTYPIEEFYKDYQLSIDHFVIGFVGRLVKDKGVAELVEAFHKLKDRHKKVKLLVVGEMEDHHGLPEEVLQTIEEDPEIIYAGTVENAAPYYALMDVLVFPTYREGFGMVAIEAMAMGTPVIASEVLGCVDTVEDGKNGFLIPPRNVEAIIDKVEFYMNHEDVRRQHGDYGREVVCEKYEQSTIWGEMLGDYQTQMKKI